MLARNVCLLATCLFAFAADPHTASVEAWRKKYEAGLKAPYTGWLSVAGLFWLKTGENPAGSAESNAIVLPTGPAYAGTFLFDGKTVRFRDPAGVVKALTTDQSGPPANRQLRRPKLVAISRN